MVLKPSTTNNWFLLTRRARNSKAPSPPHASRAWDVLVSVRSCLILFLLFPKCCSFRSVLPYFCFLNTSFGFDWTLAPKTPGTSSLVCPYIYIYIREKTRAYPCSEHRRTEPGVQSESRPEHSFFE